MGRRVKPGCRREGEEVGRVRARRGVGRVRARERSWESESEVESCGNEGRK